MAFPDTTEVEAARPEVRRIRKRSGPTWPIPAMNALLGVLLWCTPVASQTTAELPGQDRPLQVSVEELFRVGQLDGREWEMLTYVHSVSFDARGRLYVFDPWLVPWSEWAGTVPSSSSSSAPGTAQERSRSRALWVWRGTARS